jgi:hypothetical protein
MAKSEETNPEIRFVVWVCQADGNLSLRQQSAFRLAYQGNRGDFCLRQERDNDPTKNIQNFIAGEAQLSVRIIQVSSNHLLPSQDPEGRVERKERQQEHESIPEGKAREHNTKHLRRPIHNQPSKIQLSYYHLQLGNTNLPSCFVIFIIAGFRSGD